MMRERRMDPKLQKEKKGKYEPLHRAERKVFKSSRGRGCYVPFNRCGVQSCLEGHEGGTLTVLDPFVKHKVINYLATILSI